jgi:TolA-binding protein
LKRDKNSETAALALLISRIESFQTSIDGLNKSVQELSVITAKQEENVKEHMRRSDALERRQDTNETSHKAQMEVLSQRLQPIENHVKWVGTTFKIIGAIAGVAVSAFTLLKLYLEISKLLG